MVNSRRVHFRASSVIVTAPVTVMMVAAAVMVAATVVAMVVMMAMPLSLGSPRTRHACSVPRLCHRRRLSHSSSSSVRFFTRAMVVQGVGRFAGLQHKSNAPDDGIEPTEAEQERQQELQRSYYHDSSVTYYHAQDRGYYAGEENVPHQS
jgi:hypothetical protein